MIIASYNMSFASDLGIVPNKNIKGRQDSEAAFLMNNEQSRRTFWIRAASKLENFIITKKPMFVGLQELNRWEKQDPDIRVNGEDVPNRRYKTFDEMQLGSKGFQDWKEWEDHNNDTFYSDLAKENYGVEYLEYIVKNTELFQDYRSCSGEVKTSFGDFTAMCIWHKDFGEYIYAQVYPMYIEGITVNGKQYGDRSRPMLVVLTDKNKLLVTLHGPNNTRDAECCSKALSETVNAILDKFIKDAIIEDPQQLDVYITGDFNDKFGGLKEIKLPSIEEDRLVKYSNDAPKSCCYNWDSTYSDNMEEVNCVNEPMNTPCEKTQSKISKVPEGKVTAGVGERFLLPPEQGKVENYAFTGDYCFSEKGGDLKLYISQEKKKEVSDASDHELVYMEIPDDTSDVSEKVYTLEGKIVGQNGGSFSIRLQHKFNENDHVVWKKSDGIWKVINVTLPAFQHAGVVKYDIQKIDGEEIIQKNIPETELRKPYIETINILDNSVIHDKNTKTTKYLIDYSK